MEYLKDTYAYKVLAAKRKMILAVRHDLQEVGITLENYISLHFIYENPGITQAGLAEMNGKDRNVIVRTIDKLEQAGLACRERNAADRRSFSLYVTDAGEKVVDKYWDRLVQRQAECLGALTGDERAELMRLLDKVISPE
jgi:DNA-binding MarR family transcriptional regulator